MMRGFGAGTIAAAALLLLAAAALLLLAAAPAAGQSAGQTAEWVDCDPAIAVSLENSAVRGVERDQVIIRHQDEGIGDPDSIHDLSCDLGAFPAWDVLVRLPGLPDLFGALCERAKEVWREKVTRPFARSVYGLDRDLDVLPGLETRAPPLRLPGVVPDAGPDAGKVFRGILGGKDL